ncbi:MAG: hypothetical protein H6729_13680 [Deltaproteobacteria bacterium]|nr:hypothetical protein [Deltaproteobacteria bacterium]
MGLDVGLFVLASDRLAVERAELLAGILKANGDEVQIFDGTFEAGQRLALTLKDRQQLDVAHVMLGSWWLGPSIPAMRVLAKAVFVDVSRIDLGPLGALRTDLEILMARGLGELGVDALVARDAAQYEQLVHARVPARTAMVFMSNPDPSLFVRSPTNGKPRAGKRRPPRPQRVAILSSTPRLARAQMVAERIGDRLRADWAAHAASFAPEPSEPSGAGAAPASSSNSTFASSPEPFEHSVVVDVLKTPMAQIASTLKTCDLAVVLNGVRVNRVPLGVVEAMMTGLPVVIERSSLAEQVFGGTVVMSDDLISEATVDEVSSILADGKRRDDWVLRGEGWIAEHGFETNARALLVAYADAVRRKKPTSRLA